jgi:hypothetical protein
MSFRTWNVRYLNKDGLFTAADWKLTNYKLGLMGVEDIW